MPKILGVSWGDKDEPGNKIKELPGNHEEPPPPLLDPGEENEVKQYYDDRETYLIPEDMSHEDAAKLIAERKASSSAEEK